ncbi:CYTH-like phosphatase [Venustampulla echinocandica]|uniref:mRNA-capping enzyme subunit beta n=1 Tax=Venustampulla echinocandica TaxID=2656787 RepID=A0A370TAU1_9HELO|nr:CYTH-like phosphatase [Venustampulla echinocandica]RDL31054.1 CYTH-like phosphatase [Venustampulla echinocandica]
MDLKSIINTESAASSITKQAAPATPIQAPPQQAFRDREREREPDYNHSRQPSSGKQPPSQDYPAQTGGPYASPSTYQGNYQGRPPPPPPIQAPPQNDLRSPARSYSAQSPYQHTPSSSTSQYPFPQTQTPQSPAQQQQYPPSFQQHRDSYPQSNPPQHLQQHNSHPQVSPTPQTPPIGMPGAPHPYLQHQRSQSSLSASTPTPTSAQSQQPYHNQYPQDSPVSANHFPPAQIPQHQRQQSQPGTPLGPPLTQRHSSGGFPQPTSPYQQRGLSAGPFSQFQQTSPAPPAQATIPRHPSTPNASDSQRTSASEQRGSQSEREQSLSVSPKTRLPNQTRADMTTPQPENGHGSSTKRKMEDREVSAEDSHTGPHMDDKPSMNGNHSISAPGANSPKAPPKKRTRYAEPPIWAQSVRSKGAHSVTSRRNVKVNGKLPEQPLNQAPMVTRLETNGSPQLPPGVPRPGPLVDNERDPSVLLGPWERSIIGEKPIEHMVKVVADFLFQTVVSRPDMGELSSRGVDIEIEAKLGQLIDKETNQRYMLPVLSECVVADSPRIGFRSSMTEAQHSKLNHFLNAKVTETHPANLSSKKRVPIDYLHRRETDKFYVLPPALHASLPAAVREQINPRQTVKVRVTHDQKTQQILATIIKARIADLNLYIPESPLDCRLSVNFEMKFEGDIDEIIAGGVGDEIPDRHKDRLSYKQGPYQIDLTQVTTQTVTVNGVIRPEKEHELEIEIATEAIRQQGQRAAAGEPHEGSKGIEMEAQQEQLETKL